MGSSTSPQNTSPRPSEIYPDFRGGEGEWDFLKFFALLNSFLRWR